jgi:hypothetical protein
MPLTVQYKRYFKLSDFNISGVSCILERDESEIFLNSK